ncbi:hypothetical protein FACS1894189_8350 [Planctomycetales bacterium]|nr:hypothetical protein FACS1894189_8350 [Planctomycetales bacterium]
MPPCRLPDSEILALKPSDKVILHKMLKVKCEADKVKAVYSLGSGHQVKVVSDLLDIDEQTVCQYFHRFKINVLRN